MLQFINKLSDTQLINLLCFAADIPKEEIINTRIDASNKHELIVHITSSILFEGETKPMLVLDTWYLTDFAIESYDIAMTAEEIQTTTQSWRSMLYQLFKKDYALAYLMQT